MTNKLIRIYTNNKKRMITMDYVGLGVVFTIIAAPLLFWIIKEAVKCGIIEAYKIIKNSHME